MNILFIGYWGASDGLSISTIHPHLEILSKIYDVKKVIYISFERGHQVSSYLAPSKKVIHYPIPIEGKKSRLLNKVSTIVNIPFKILEIAEKHNIDVCIARSTLAGIFAYKLWKRKGIPFFIESLEPHARYMLESKVWSKYGPSYFFQMNQEAKQIKNASGLMPVTNNFRKYLVDQGVDSNKIKVVPCAVNVAKFEYSESARSKIRSELGIESDRVVGIYVGKFGGNYLDDEALQVFRWSFDSINNFYLIILTPQDKNTISKKLASWAINDQNFYIDEVPHESIPDFLSASDFAYATYRPGNSKKYLSPIKVGEYWANGLPVFLTEGVGDDSEIIKKSKKGVVFQPDENSVKNALEEVKKQILQNDRSPELALKYRNFEMVRNAYKHFLGVIR